VIRPSSPRRREKRPAAETQGHGTFRWRDFGEIRAVSQAVSVLRGKLRGAFGIAGDPFYEWDGGWKARFFARSEEVSRAG
jgi:hypothetical protein